MFAAGKAVSGAEATDAQFNYVTMLLHGDGTNGAQNNTFLDSSTNAFSITRNGNTTQGTFTPYGANWSAYTNALSTYFTSGTSAVFGFGTGDWTFEFFIFATSFTDNQFIVDFRPSGSSGSIFPWIYLTTTGVLNYGTDGAIKINSSAGAVSNSTWTHVAVSKASGSTRMFVNGTQVGSTFADSYNYDTSARFVSGTFGDAPGGGGGTGFVQGYLSNLRILKGTGLYTGSYTVPTAPLTAITNTSCLTFQSNRFVDTSSNSIAITPTGSPSVQRFSPFAPLTVYNPTTNGGSGYFDGSGDYLSASSNAVFATPAQYTIEFWAYVLATPTNYAGFYVSDVAGGLQIGYNTGGGGVFGVGRSTVAWDLTTAAFGLNQWVHVAITRDGSNVTRIFYNGVQQTSGTLTTSYPQGTAIIGYNGSGGSGYINGYVSDFRYVKGTAVYTAAFTPPTAPLTAITSTSLLLSYTNPAILDNAMLNNLETVDNAQISTSVKKYGTGSIAFDGTGDYLVSTPKNIFALGSGNFTIEMWIYPNNVSTNEMWLVAQADYSSNIGWSVFLNNNTVKFRLGNTGGTIQSSASVVASAWQHLALSRVGTTLTMYLGGTSIGSGTVNNFTDANLALVVGGITTTTGWNGNLPYSGYIDDLRITKGVARYTANFTAPTAAFADKG